MRRPTLLVLSTAFLLVHAAGPAFAEEPNDPRTDPRTLVAEIWTAMGSADVVAEDGFRDGEFMFMTGVLGLARFAPFEVGLSLDVGGTEDVHVLVGPVVGLGLDLVPGLRAEGLIEFGGHYVDGIGWGWAGDGSDERSTWLAQGGLRLGLSGRIGRDNPRIVIGGWVALYRDLTTKTMTITDSGGGGAGVWEVGGAMGLIAVRFGFEW